ncbi:hypothetical protein D3C75_552340 [compost metagenome]
MRVIEYGKYPDDPGIGGSHGNQGKDSFPSEGQDKAALYRHRYPGYVRLPAYPSCSQVQYGRRYIGFPQKAAYRDPCKGTQCGTDLHLRHHSQLHHSHHLVYQYWQLAQHVYRLLILLVRREVSSILRFASRKLPACECTLPLQLR